MELGRLIKHEIHIFPTDNKGFVVRIGCGYFVAESVDSLIDKLRRYLTDPERWEEEYKRRLGGQPTGASVLDLPPLSKLMSPPSIQKEKF